MGTHPLWASSETLAERASAKYSVFDHDVLPMWVAEMDVVLAPAVSEVLRRAIDTSDTGYADPRNGIAEAFTGFAARRWGWEVATGEVRLAPDVGVAMVETLRALVRPGDKLAFSPPVYPPFFDWVREVGCEIVEAPLARGEAGWRLDLEAIEAAFEDGARAYLLCNPHNPVGRAHTREELIALAELADRYGAIVVSDEIHAPLVLSGATFTPYLDADPTARGHGVALHSASKAWNLAGLKCALIVVPEHTADGPARVRAGLPAELSWRAGHLGVLANRAAYDDGEGWLDELLTALDGNRRLVTDLLAEHLPDVGYVPPEASFLAWLDVGRAGWGADPSAALVEQCGVALSRGLDFGRQGAGFLRLNLGCAPDRLREAVQRMAGFKPEHKIVTDVEHGDLAGGDPRRRTPRTDTVLDDARLAAARERLGRERVKAVVSETLQRCRAGEIAPADVCDAVLAAVPAAATSLREVVNATGVVVHTNLGRAPLSAAAVEALTIAAGSTDVELDLTDGRRGRRGAGVLQALAAAVPEAGGVHVVNNGAAALALVTCALGQGREVVVARGEMVEIGDGFRIPELVESLGARLREVGTTNRVRLSDYEAALGPDTAFVLKVHPSNFRVEGFTSSVPLAELAGLPVPVVADIGSGLLAPHPRLPDEPDAASSLRDGASLVTASGDKLLGGPQCGLLLGDAALVERLRRHPFARALRVDKLTLAALEATLTGPTPPVASALAADTETLMLRAKALALEVGPPAEAVTSTAAIGGGGAPGVDLPSAAVALPEEWAGPLRADNPAVVGRLHEGRLLLDLVAVPADHDATVAAAVRRVAARTRMQR